jgi:hypothetical protein
MKGGYFCMGQIWILSRRLVGNLMKSCNQHVGSEFNEILQSACRVDCQENDTLCPGWD